MDFELDRCFQIDVNMLKLLQSLLRNMFKITECKTPVHYLLTIYVPGVCFWFGVDSYVTVIFILMYVNIKEEILKK